MEKGSRASPWGPPEYSLRGMSSRNPSVPPPRAIPGDKLTGAVLAPLVRSGPFCRLLSRGRHCRVAEAARGKPRVIVARHKNPKSDDDGSRVVSATRRYIPDFEWLAERQRARRRFTMRCSPDIRTGSTAVRSGVLRLPQSIDIDGKTSPDQFVRNRSFPIRS